MTIEYWPQVLTIVASNVGLFLWSRRESKADYRHLQNMIEKISSDIRKDMQDFKETMHKESKDFHGRLLQLETRKMMEKK